jgi:long-chain acyl-CoA synthetase
MAGMQLRAWFGAVVKEWDATVMQVLPLFHVYGNAGVMASSLIGHNPLALVPDPRDIKDVISAMRKLRPALLPCVPTFFTMLLKHPYVTAGKADFSYTLGISGAAPISPETVKKFKELTGSRIIEGYGLTESMMAAIINPVKGVNKPGSIGMPLPDVEVRIADADTGEGSLPAGKNGEIMMKAPNLMLEYYHRPEETANVIRGGWLTTGDIGYLDEDGYVFIVGRKKDLIKAGGFQIWPQEVEDVIAAMPGIADVSVAGVPDPYRGETVKAWVVLQPGQSVTEEAIKAWCREKLSSYKVPALIEFRAILPKSLIGKALHRQLVEEHKEKQAVRK